MNAEDVKFEAVEPPQPGEEEGERIEQPRLRGAPVARTRAPRAADGDDDEFGDDELTRCRGGQEDSQ